MKRPPPPEEDPPTGEREDVTEEQLSAVLGRWQLTRRDLLKLVASAAAAGALQASPGSGAALARRDRVLGGPHEAVLQQSAGAFSATVLRPKDLLSLRFEFLNLQLKTDQPLGARHERVHAAAAAYIVVHFPPQNIAERAFTETETPGVACPDPNTGDETGCLSVPVDARIAGASRLAFKVPSGVSYIPYSLAHEQGLLAWERLEPSVVP
ncbi:MAG: twin-arginine translocation signal domain-containing protein, partial [Chloroflexi bacterium]|nr:twin-arginine translocation signal domain-containing protein [Chloroflexota bacterium]